VTFFERLAALGWFLLAAAWFLFSDLVAMRAASGLTFGEWYEPLYRIFLLFLLVLGYSLMSLLTRRGVPVRKGIGLDRRRGRWGEFALGAALGWGGVVACVLPAALVGGLVFTVFTNSHQFLVATLDLIALAAGTLAIEIAFRGYAFRRLVDAMGPAMATLFLAAIYAIWRTHATPTTTAAVVVSFLLGWIVALAALRTRALWVSWGFSFAWGASMSLLFGLPMPGGMNYSPIFVTNAAGRAWVSGGAQGPEGSAFGVVVAFLLLIVVVRATSDLHYKYAFSEVVPGGVPVDIEAAAQQQHETAMGSAQPSEPQLVQIVPASGAAFAGPQTAAHTEAAAGEAGSEATSSEEQPGPESS
jgi:uncharacterized protein